MKRHKQISDNHKPGQDRAQGSRPRIAPKNRTQASHPGIAPRHRGQCFFEPGALPPIAKQHGKSTANAWTRISVRTPLQTLGRFNDDFERDLDRGGQPSPRTKWAQVQSEANIPSLNSYTTLLYGT